MRLATDAEASVAWENTQQCWVFSRSDYMRVPSENGNSSAMSSMENPQQEPGFLLVGFDKAVSLGLLLELLQVLRLARGRGCN